MDTRLEEIIRQARAHPDDKSKRLRLVLELTRADRLQQAQAFLAKDHDLRAYIAVEYVRDDQPELAQEWLGPLSQDAQQSMAENPLAQSSQTALSPLPVSRALLDAAALVSARLGQNPLLFFGLRAHGASEFTKQALELVLAHPDSQKPFAQHRIAAALLHHDCRQSAQTFLDQFPQLDDTHTSLRLLLAALCWRHGLDSEALATDPCEGIRQLATAPREAGGIPDPFVGADDRLATEDSPVYPMERQPSRLFGAHGGDFTYGPVMVLRTRLDHRLLIFEEQVIAGLRELMIELVDHFSLPPCRDFSFSDGYGFSWEEELQPDEKHAANFAELINNWHILPGRLEWSGRRPYDIVDNNTTLCHRLHRDMERHPVRSPKYDEQFWRSPAMDLLRQVGPSRPKTPPKLDDFLERSREVYSSPGVQAIERFVASLSRPSRLFLPFSED